jgi:SAM-dependent methyltransferase
MDYAMRMNSPIGKKILSIVRQGDFAHPGEEEAIEIALKSFQPDKERTILDVGCGRGGTAHYLQSRGWGKVTGFDIDQESIAYAQTTYPAVTFIDCDIYKSSRFLAKRFDLICLFTTFYILPDQRKALQELRSLASSQGSIVIFDYLDLSEDGETLHVREEEGVIWNPIKLRLIDECFASCGWKVTAVTDQSPNFCSWYGKLVDRIEACQVQITNGEGPTWYQFVHDFYGGMLDSIKRGVLGGVLITARAG